MVVRWVAGPPGARAEAVEDLYVDNARLRLRRATPVGGGEAIPAAVEAWPADAQDVALLRRGGGDPVGRPVRGAAGGLFLAEAEFAEDAAMAAFPHPAFALREVIADPRYTGGELVRAGVPAEPG